MRKVPRKGKVPFISLTRNNLEGSTVFMCGLNEEYAMPILLLWAVPAVIVVGGAGYWLIHLH
jgi:hypothetical protein